MSQEKVKREAKIGIFKNFDGGRGRIAKSFEIFGFEARLVELGSPQQLDEAERQLDVFNSRCRLEEIFYWRMSRLWDIV
jgi:hypothetical protein